MVHWKRKKEQRERDVGVKRREAEKKRESGDEMRSNCHDGKKKKRENRERSAHHEDMRAAEKQLKERKGGKTQKTANGYRGIECAQLSSYDLNRPKNGTVQPQTERF